jgi:1-acyl-sn-glycerol-3-phosphate acyltransferase
MNVMNISPASAQDSIPVRSVDGDQPWDLGPNSPQARGYLLRTLSHVLMRTIGWKLEGSFPDTPRFIVIVAPHTSNWDFIIGLIAKWSLALQLRFIAKHTLFYPPLGWFMRSIGGVPVVRTERNNLVDQSVAEFARRERFILVVAPEGTRSNVDRWKSGFWHIAQRAHVPVCCVALDYARKIVRVGQVIVPAENEDAVAGIARVQQAYADVRGYRNRKSATSR